MPIYDLTCKNNHIQRDLYLNLGERPPCPECGEATETLWDKTANVIGDECDIWIRHGICNEDGSPRHYTSKEEMRRETERRGLTNKVVHTPERGGDKSKHTSRWI